MVSHDDMGRRLRGWLYAGGYFDAVRRGTASEEVQLIYEAAEAIMVMGSQLRAADAIVSSAIGQNGVLLRDVVRYQDARREGNLCLPPEEDRDEG